jgi:hypothetical protein
MKRPKLRFYDFADRFKDNVVQEDMLASGANTESVEEFSDLIVNEGEVDHPDDEDEWLYRDPVTSRFDNADGAIDASPVALDSTFITAAFSLNEPAQVFNFTHSSLSNLPELSSGGLDNDFSLPFEV